MGNSKLRLLGWVYSYSIVRKPDGKVSSAPVQDCAGVDSPTAATSESANEINDLYVYVTSSFISTDFYL